MICEIDQAAVEIYFEVTKFTNECKELISHRTQKYIGQSLATISSVPEDLTSGSRAHATDSVGASFGQVATGGALTDTTAVGSDAKYSDELNRIEKEKDELMVFLDTKQKEISEKQKKINDFLKKSAVLTNVALEDYVDREMSNLEKSLVPQVDLATKTRSIFEECTERHMENDVKTLEDAIKSMNCKQRVINSIFRGNFEASERMITLTKRNIELKIRV